MDDVELETQYTGLLAKVVDRYRPPLPRIKVLAPFTWKHSKGWGVGLHLRSCHTTDEVDIERDEYKQRASMRLNRPIPIATL